MVVKLAEHWELQLVALRVVASVVNLVDLMAEHWVVHWAEKLAELKVH